MTQCEKILNYIRTYGSITSMEAFEKLKITRLSGRINDLRANGYDIETIYVKGKDGTRYGRYMFKKN